MSWYLQLSQGTRIVIASLTWFCVIPAAIAFTWSWSSERRMRRRNP